MSPSINFSTQELKILNYLENHSGLEVGWEELAQFAKDPQNVKLKTIQKSVSELKRKFTQANEPITFNVKFVSMSKKNEAPQPPAQQNLVLVKRTPAGNIVPATNTKHPAQIDFAPDGLGFKRVRTKSGSYQLNDAEWDMFKYFYNNPARIITISELRDKVVFPQFGSKLPARWFDSIMRIINNMRRQVKDLDGRLLTVKGAETSYLFQ